MIRRCRATAGICVSLATLALTTLSSVSAPVAQAAGTIGLGTQTIGANTDSNSAGSAESFQATATASGSVASLTVYVDSTSKATSVIVGLYSDNSGQPGALLTQGTISSPAAGAWDTAAVPAASITSGTPYWISVLSPSGAGEFAFRDTPSGTLSENSSQTNLPPFPRLGRPVRSGTTHRSLIRNLGIDGPEPLRKSAVRRLGGDRGRNEPCFTKHLGDQHRWWNVNTR